MKTYHLKLFGVIAACSIAPGLYGAAYSAPEEYNKLEAASHAQNKQLGADIELSLKNNTLNPLEILFKQTVNGQDEYRTSTVSAGAKETLGNAQNIWQTVGIKIKPAFLSTGFITNLLYGDAEKAFQAYTLPAVKAYETNKAIAVVERPTATAIANFTIKTLYQPHVCTLPTFRSPFSIPEGYASRLQNGSFRLINNSAWPIQVYDEIGHPIMELQIASGEQYIFPNFPHNGIIQILAISLTGSDLGQNLYSKYPINLYGLPFNAQAGDCSFNPDQAVPQDPRWTYDINIGTNVLGQWDVSLTGKPVER